jgi:hypothetical protein
MAMACEVSDELARGKTRKRSEMVRRPPRLVYEASLARACLIAMHAYAASLVGSERGPAVADDNIIVIVSLVFVMSVQFRAERCHDPLVALPKCR